MCWVRPAILHLCRTTLFSISGVSYVIAFLLVEFFFFTFGAGVFPLASQAATWSVPWHLHSEALLVFRTNGVSSGFVAIFWGVQVLCVCVCVCVAFERRKGGIFGLIGTRNGLPRHQVSTLAIDESLSLCEGREMDGKSNLIDWLYRALFYLIG
jgi:hypothetical protein